MVCLLSYVIVPLFTQFFVPPQLYAPNVKTATIAGTTINSTTGTPVGHVALTLREISPEASQYINTSDGEGHFGFADLKPGQYILSGERPGFLSGRYGCIAPRCSAGVLTITQDQQLNDLRLVIAPQGVISGHVLDENREPLEGIVVALMQWKYRNGWRLLEVTGGTGFTNDRGEYRISRISPGKYYLVAVPRANLPGNVWSSSLLWASEGQVGFVMTYYPQSVDLMGASALQVIPGSDLNTIDVGLQKKPVFKVSGSVVYSETGNLVTDATLALAPSVSKSMALVSDTVDVHVANGRFMISGLSSGSYDLVTKIMRNGITIYAGQELNVVGSDISEVKVTIPSTVNLTGRLLPSGAHQDAIQAWNPTQLNKVQVVMSPVNEIGMGTPTSAHVGSDGAFIFHDLIPGEYNISVAGLPDSWYLEWIRVSGQRVKSRFLRLSRDDNVDLRLVEGAAVVTGSVVGPDNTMQTEAAVALVPDLDDYRQRINLLRSTTTDEHGRFHLRGVVPGKYKFFACEQADIEAVQDPDFLKKFDGKAEPIMLDQGEAKTAVIQIMPTDEVNRLLDVQ